MNKQLIKLVLIFVSLTEAGVLTAAGAGPKLAGLDQLLVVSMDNTIFRSMKKRISVGYICVVAATVRFGVYQYRSWWRWSGDWKPEKIMRIRDIRLSAEEIAVLLLGFVLVILGAWRETVFAVGG